MSKRFNFLSKLLRTSLLVAFSISTLNAKIINPNQSGQLQPDLQGTSMREGYKIKWLSGHSQYFSDLGNDIFTIPDTKNEDWYLIGHRIQFSSTGLDNKNFTAQESLIKDIFSTRIVPTFKRKASCTFHFDYGDRNFSTAIGLETEFSESFEVVNQQANWLLTDDLGVRIKSLNSSISYSVTSFYSKADISLSGNVHLNLDQQPVTNGFVKFVRLGPGKKRLESVSTLQESGQFEAHNLAAGNYKILFGEVQDQIKTPLVSLITIDQSTAPLELSLRFQTEYDITLDFKKSGENIDISANLQWSSFNVSIPYGLAAQDTSNELVSLPHFIGDFNSNVRLDRDGNPLTIPYADDNIDELIFLTWNNQAQTQQLSGTHEHNECTLKDPRDNRLYFTSTLKPTEYGPWVLKEKKFYVNWSLAYQCGPNHGQDLHSIPLADTAVGDINELGEIQSEVSAIVLEKIKLNQPFSIEWKFKDLSDQGDIQVVIKATPKVN